MKCFSCGHSVNDDGHDSSSHHRVDCELMTEFVTIVTYGNNCATVLAFIRADDCDDGAGERIARNLGHDWEEENQDAIERDCACPETSAAYLDGGIYGYIATMVRAYGPDGRLVGIFCDADAQSAYEHDCNVTLHHRVG
jgi:hypothetical protein